MALNDNALTIADNINLAINTDDIERLINTASTIIEGHCNTHFKKDSYSEKLKPSGEKYLSVNYWNIESVDSITFGGEDIDSEDYTILDNQGMLYNPCGWPEANDYLLDIEVTAGFILPQNDSETRTLPENVEQACIVLVRELYKAEQGGYDIQRLTRGGVSKTYFDRKGLPDTVRWLLANWRFIPV